MLFGRRGVPNEKRGPLLICNERVGQAIMVECCSSSRGHTFTAEFVVYAAAGGATWLPGVPSLPETFVVSTQPIVQGVESPTVVHVLSACELAEHLASRGDRWVYHPVVVDLSRTDVLGAVSAEALGDAFDIGEEARRAADHARSMRAVRLLKRAQRPWREHCRRPRARPGATGPHAQAQKHIGLKTFGAQCVVAAGMLKVTRASVSHMRSHVYADCNT